MRLVSGDGVVVSAASASVAAVYENAGNVRFLLIFLLRCLTLTLTMTVFTISQEHALVVVSSTDACWL